MKSAHIEYILVDVMRKTKLILALFGLMLAAAIGLGSFGATAMSSMTDSSSFGLSASVRPAADAGSAVFGDHHGNLQDRRSLPGHHEGRHGGKSGTASGSSCCAVACSPMMFSDAHFELSASVFSDRYCFSNTAVTVSIFGDPPLRPPRLTA